MALLDMLQAVCNEVGLPEPTAVVTSSDRQVQQLLATVHRVLNDLKQVQWAELTRLHEITLADGVDSYALPADFDFRIFETQWNQDKNWPLFGPYGPKEWQEIKQSGIAPAISQRFRFKGYTSKQFFIDPVPTSSEDGQVVSFEYQSKNIIRPRIWSASALYTAGAYTFYDGNYYTTTLGGTTGATPPTHTTGSVSDGGVTWSYTDEAYTSYLADTDVCHVDEFLVGLGVQWNYLASKGLPYQHLEQKFNRDIRSTVPKLPGASIIYLDGRSENDLPMVIVPETGFGS